MPSDPFRPARVAGVVLPIRSFRLGMARLGDRLDPGSRIELATYMAQQVHGAAGTLPTVIISSAVEVRAWAAARGLDCVDDPGSLDAAAAAGIAWCEARGLARTIVAHADLPLAGAGSLERLAAIDGSVPTVTLVPCHRDDGTPVLSIPNGSGFVPAYGAGSFRRHVAEARRLALGVRVVRDPRLGFDVDVPADLRRFAPTERVAGSRAGSPAA